MNFEVDTSMLGALTKKLRENLENISQQRSEMYSQLEALDGMWEGEAHDTFVAQYQIDHELMRKLLNELGTLAEHVGVSKENYDDCEEEALKLIRAISI